MVKGFRTLWNDNFVFCCVLKISFEEGHTNKRQTLLLIPYNKTCSSLEAAKKLPRLTEFFPFQVKSQYVVVRLPEQQSSENF